MQQDFTAPEYRVKVSRREAYRQVFEVVEANETTPINLSAYVFGLWLYGRNGLLVLSLSETDGLSRPQPHMIEVFFSTSRMNSLASGTYTGYLSGVRNGEVEEFVVIKMEVE